LEDWSGREAHSLSALSPVAPERGRIERNVGDFLTALRDASVRCPAPFLVCLCPESAGLRVDAEARAFLDRMDERLRAGVDALANGYFVGGASVLEAYPVERYDDKRSNRFGHIPYTPEFFAALSLTIARRTWRLRTIPHKVIALDLDGTLWTGV